MTVGKRIKQIRESLGLRQEELAKRASVSRTYIIQLENDRSSKPSATVLFSIAVALGTTIAELLGKKDKTKATHELPKSSKEAFKIYPEMKVFEDDLIGWKFRGKYPTTAVQWFTLYTILKGMNK